MSEELVYRNHVVKPAQQQPVPGPCDPVTGCPPPTEIACIKVDKVYESCRVSQVNNHVVTITPIGPVTDVQCISAQMVPDTLTCTILPGPGGRVRASFQYTFTVRWVDDLGPHTTTSTPIAAEFTVRMARAGEPGLQPQCEVYLECIDAFLSNTTEITACIGKLVLFKLFAHVQLLVPTYGFCPEPEECQIAGECPEWQPGWPPYPPQTT